MNKVHRLKLLFISKILRLCKFLSNEKYREISTYYFRECGVVFHGIPKYINYDVDFDLTKPGLIHVGNNTVITKAQFDMRKSASASVQSFVSLSFLRNYPIPLPPLAEQKRIVAKLEELLPLCERLKR